MMKIRVYAHRDEVEVITRKEWETKREITAKQIIGDEDEFAEWLESNFTALEIWGYDEKDRKSVRQDWEQYATDTLAENAMNDEWKEFELEV